MLFKDIDERHEYFKEISLVTNSGLLKKTSDGKFDPYDSVTVGDFMKCVWYLLGRARDPILQWPLDGSRESERGHWAEIYLVNCRALGIDYSADLLPKSVLAIGEALRILCLAGQALSSALNMEFSFDPAKYSSDKYTYYSDTDDVTKVHLACLLYCFCYQFGNYVIEHDTHTVNGQLFILSPQSAFFLAFSNSEILRIVELMQEHHCSDFDIYSSMKRILGYKREVLDTLQYKGSTPVYHYTRLSTLAVLAPNSFGFRLSNAAFLNDPSEGHLLTQYFQAKNRELSSLSQNLTSDIVVSNTYLASFCSKCNELPMWVQYGDNAAGCAIGFDPHGFRLPVYRVSYTLDPFQSFFDQVNSEFSRIAESPKFRLQLVPVLILVQYIYRCLGELGYLYKDQHYSHEHELRIIATCHPKSAEKEPNRRDGELFHRTFVNVPYKISSVTFGVNVSDPKKLVVGLASVGLNCKFNRSDIPFQN